MHYSQAHTRAMFISGSFFSINLTTSILFPPPLRTQTKAKGEIALLDNNMKSRKQQFGIEMYDLMEQKKTFGGKSETEPKVVEVFDQAAKDIAMIIEKKDAKQGEIDALGANDKDLPAESMGEKAKKAGNQAKDAAVTAIDDGFCDFVGVPRERIGDWAVDRQHETTRDVGKIHLCHERVGRVEPKGIMEVHINNLIAA